MAFELARIDDDRAPRSGKPEPAVARDQAGRTSAAIALAALHAVLRADHAIDGHPCRSKVDELEQTRPREAKHAAVRRHPQRVPSLQDAPDGIVGKPVASRHPAEWAAGTAHEESRADRADVEDPVLIL